MLQKIHISSDGIRGDANANNIDVMSLTNISA